MQEYERIYKKLLEDEELSNEFIGDWEVDKGLFLLMQGINEDTVSNYIDDDDDEYFFEEYDYGGY